MNCVFIFGKLCFIPKGTAPEKHFKFPVILQILIGKLFHTNFLNFKILTSGAGRGGEGRDDILLKAKAINSVLIDG